MPRTSDGDSPASAGSRLSSGDDASHLHSLVLAVTAGEVGALARLYALTVRHVFKTAFIKLHCREDAEEIVIDVYRHVWQNSIDYDVHRGSVMAWLAIMTRNRAIDRLRGRRSSVSFDDRQHETLALSPEPGPEQALSVVQSNRSLHHALQCLDSDRRALLRLAFFEGLTHEEIAAAANLPLGTVKSHVRRALATLQRQLLGDG